MINQGIDLPPTLGFRMFYEDGSPEGNMERLDTRGHI